MLEPITHPLLTEAGVRHGFFTRQGGVSTGLYQGLNVGIGSDDDPAAVIENRRRAAEHFGMPEGALNSCYQIHSATALIADRPWNGERPQADGVVANRPGVACGALAADCAPILLADPKAGVVAAAHAGWKGALAGIAGATVLKMQELGARPADIVAVVGPCIAQASYEVGVDFQDRFTHHDPGSDRFFKPGAADDKRLFDLPGFVLWRLQQAGVGQAVWTGHDTCADETRFFSNRRAFQHVEPDFGRLISVISA